MDLATPAAPLSHRCDDLTRGGISCGGFWQEVLNGDVREYGGRGQGNFGGLEASLIPSHGRPASLNLMLPPLAVVCFKSAGSCAPGVSAGSTDKESDPAGWTDDGDQTRGGGVPRFRRTPPSPAGIG